MIVEHHGEIVKRHLKGRTLGGYADMMLNVVFPPRCALCKDLMPIDWQNGSISSVRSQGRCPASQPSVSAVVEGFNDLLKPYLCGNCRGVLEPMDPPICPMCGCKFKSRQDGDHLCGDCIRQPKHFRQARAAGKYNGVLAVLIHRFKYGKALRLAAPLGEILFQSFRVHWETQPVDCIVPMPLHKRRLRQRKFNQSTRLLRNWRRLSRVYGDGSPAWKIEPGVLERVRHQPPQTGLNRKQRLGNIKNAFQVVRSDKIKAKYVLIVDDVYTTGATVNECAKTLKKGGAEQVDVLTLARA